MDSLELGHESFLLPAVLLVLASIPVFWWRWRDHGAVGPALAGLRWLAYAALLALLLKPQIRTEHQEPARILAALEVSPQLRKGELEQFREELAQLSANSQAEAQIQSFGPEDPADPHRALARLLLSPDRLAAPARLLFASSGQLVSPSAPIDPGESRPILVPLRRKEERSARIVAVELQAHEDPSKPLLIHVDGEAGPGRVAGRLEVFLDSHRVRDLPLDLSEGSSRTKVSLPPPPKHAALLTVRFSPDDSTLPPSSRGVLVRVRKRKAILVIAPSEKSLIARALKVQGLDVHVADGTALTRPLLDSSLLVIDRIDPLVVARSKALPQIEKALGRGAGLLYLPPEEGSGLFNPEAEAFLRLLPLKGEAPPPPPAPSEEKPKLPGNKGLAPPDPTKKKKEKRQAPTLGLLLVLDASGSMKGERLRLAKLAAIAAADVLHPDDRIGVIAFNSRATVIRELSRAGDRSGLRDRVRRIKASGATDFFAALSLAKDVLLPESLGIRHIILLSDGDSIAHPLKPLVTEMVQGGITLSTVGCGREFNIQRLSDLAAWGRGKFHPANGAAEVPEIFTVEVERVVEASGARKKSAPRSAAPPPPLEKKEAAKEEPAKEKIPPRQGLRLAWPSSYTRGIDPTRAQGVSGLHPNHPRVRAWPSLRLESGEVVLAHGHRGAGRVACFSLPLEGRWASALSAWEDLPLLLAQLARFLAQVPGTERFAITVVPQGRGALLRVADRERRHLPDEGAEWSFHSSSGALGDVPLERLGPDSWIWNGEGAGGAGVLGATFGLRGEKGVGRVVVPVPPPRPAAGGVRLAGLEEWAEALSGELVPALPSGLEFSPRPQVVVRPFAWAAIPWIAAVLFLELILRRRWPRALRWSTPGDSEKPW